MGRKGGKELQFGWGGIPPGIFSEKKGGRRCLGETLSLKP